MATEFENYPKGRIAIQGGELQDAFDIALTFEDGKQTVHTFRGKGMANGMTTGKKKSTVTFKSAVSANGMERAYMEDWNSNKKINVRVKIPGKTITINGNYTKPNFGSMNVDNFIEFSISVEGKFSFSNS
jgi:hypothetical protein